MKLNIFNTLIILAIVGIFSILIWDTFIQRDSNQKVEQILSEIQIQSNKIDSITQENDKLTLQLQQYRLALDSINNRIYNTKLQLQTLNKQTNEKLNNIKYYSVNELERFFTERYSDRLNSKD